MARVSLSESEMNQCGLMTRETISFNGTAAVSSEWASLSYVPNPQNITCLSGVVQCVMRFVDYWHLRRITRLGCRMLCRMYAAMKFDLCVKVSGGEHHIVACIMGKVVTCGTQIECAGY